MGGVGLSNPREKQGGRPLLSRYTAGIRPRRLRIARGITEEAMQDSARLSRAVTRAAAAALMGLLLVGGGRAQQPEGPQTDAPPPVAPPAAAPRTPGTTLKVPA